MEIKRLHIFIFLIISFNWAYGQDEIRSNLPQIEFKETVHDFGEIEYNTDGTYEFKFKNIGNGPLLITKVRTS